MDYFCCQLDFYLRQKGGVCIGYSRISIVFGSITIFSSMLQLKLKYLKKSSVISLLSKYTLGIFATHKYWHLFVTYVFIYNGFKYPIYARIYPYDLLALFIAAISILLSIMTVMIAGNTFIKKLVS